MEGHMEQALANSLFPVYLSLQAIHKDKAFLQKRLVVALVHKSVGSGTTVATHVTNPFISLQKILPCICYNDNEPYVFETPFLCVPLIALGHLFRP